MSEQEPEALVSTTDEEDLLPDPGRTELRASQPPADAIFTTGTRVVLTPPEDDS